jgi:hypothetical protein
MTGQIQASAALSQGKAFPLSRAGLEFRKRKKYFGFAGNQTRESTDVHHYADFNALNPEDNAFKLTLFFHVKGHPVELYCTGLFNCVRREEQSCDTFTARLLIFFQNG